VRFYKSSEVQPSLTIEAKEKEIMVYVLVEFDEKFGK